jgi:hypothetical protein
LALSTCGVEVSSLFAADDLRGDIFSLRMLNSLVRVYLAQVSTHSFVAGLTEK